MITKKEELIEALKSKSDLSEQEVSAKLEEASVKLSEAGVPHLMIAGYAVKGKTGEYDHYATTLKCQGASVALLELLLGVGLQDEKYYDLFVGLGEILKQMKESGVLEMIKSIKGSQNEVKEGK